MELLIFLLGLVAGIGLALVVLLAPPALYDWLKARKWARITAAKEPYQWHKEIDLTPDIVSQISGPLQLSETDRRLALLEISGARVKSALRKIELNEMTDTMPAITKRTRTLNPETEA